MFGSKVKDYRISKGMTQEELARSLNISQNTLSQYESGRRTPSIKRLFAIAQKIGCEASDLLDSGATERHA